MTDLALLQEAMALKALPRAGWKRVGVPSPESVAAHSWGVALTAAIRCPAHLDREKVLLMALIHDLAEVRIGDITPHDGIVRQEKKRRETEAARALFGEHPALLALWLEADEQTSEEARFVKQCDLTDMGLQAQVYAAAGHETSEFRTATASHLGELAKSRG